MAVFKAICPETPLTALKPALHPKFPHFCQGVGKEVTDLPKLETEVIQLLRNTFARNPQSMRKMRGLLYHLLEIQAMADLSVGASSAEGYRLQ